MKIFKLICITQFTQIQCTNIWEKYTILVLVLVSYTSHTYNCSFVFVGRINGHRLQACLVVQILQYVIINRNDATYFATTNYSFVRRLITTHALESLNVKPQPFYVVVVVVVVFSSLFSLIFIVFCYKFLISTFAYVGTDTSHKTSHRQAWKQSTNLTRNSIWVNALARTVISKWHVGAILVVTSLTWKILEKYSRRKKCAHCKRAAAAAAVGDEEKKNCIYTVWLSFIQRQRQTVKFYFHLCVKTCTQQINIEHFNWWLLNARLNVFYWQTNKMYFYFFFEKKKLK